MTNMIDTKLSVWHKAKVVAHHVRYEQFNTEVNILGSLACLPLCHGRNLERFH